MWASVLVVASVAVAAADTVCPRGCRCSTDLRTVICSARVLTHVPTDIPLNVTELDLSDNYIRRVSPESLSGLSRLKRLDLSGNSISQLGAGVFSGLRALEELSLAGNLIRSLSDVSAGSLLANLTSLARLSLADNPLVDVSTTPLASDSLRELDLSRCQLAKLDGRDTLTRLPSLLVLNASGNPLKWIRDVESSSLQKLDVSQCQLDSLGGSAVRGLSALLILHVGGNRQLRLGEPRLASATLRRLHAADCALDSPAITDLPALEHVWMRGNKIEELREKDFNSSGHIVRLDLSVNLISSMEKFAFRPLSELETLILAGNKIRSLEADAFAHNPKLKWLYLSANPLTVLPPLRSLSLRALDVSACRLAELSRVVFRDLALLQVANLSANLLQVVPDRLYSRSVHTLDLSLCRLTAVSNETFVSMTNLQYLYLHGNRLTIVPKSSMVSGLTRIRRLTLHDNPWRCECAEPDFRFLWDNLTVTSPPIVTVQERQILTCASPEGVAGQEWWSACAEVWYPPSHNTGGGGGASRGGAAALGLIAMVATVVALCCYLRQRLDERRKERLHDAEDSAREADEMEARLRRQHSEAMLRQELEAMTRLSPDSRSRRTESQQTQPPSYEEALLMARSMEELHERNNAAAAAEAARATEGPSASGSGGGHARAARSLSSSSVSSAGSLSLSGVSSGGGSSSGSEETVNTSRAHAT